MFPSPAFLDFKNTKYMVALFKRFMRIKMFPISLPRHLSCLTNLCRKSLPNTVRKIYQSKVHTKIQPNLPVNPPTLGDVNCGDIKERESLPPSLLHHPLLFYCYYAVSSCSAASSFFLVFRWAWHVWVCACVSVFRRGHTIIQQREGDSEHLLPQTKWLHSHFRRISTWKALHPSRRFCLDYYIRVSHAHSFQLFSQPLCVSSGGFVSNIYSKWGTDVVHVAWLMYFLCRGVVLSLLNCASYIPGESLGCGCDLPNLFAICLA